MFTGIIELKGVVSAVVHREANVEFTITSALSHELKVDQSVAHDGVCLTVTSMPGSGHEASHIVTAIAETLSKTSLGNWQPGTEVNLERCLPAQGRFDGHFVQGHVDTTVALLSVEDQAGSWLLTLDLPVAYAHLVIEKGSVCLNGISLTAFGVTDRSFQVAIIPYTWEHTNINKWQTGQLINVEWDILGKYLDRWRSLGR